MGYDLIEVTPLAGALGAEISGVDMAQPLGNQLFQEVHDALIENQVIFFRDQDITPAQHVDFARRFGTLQVHPLVPHLDEPSGSAGAGEQGRETRNAANAWHSDVTFGEEPPLGSILLARTVPERGGDTIWADMYAAYEALSPAMKRYLEGMTAVHQRRRRAVREDARERRRARRRGEGDQTGDRARGTPHRAHPSGDRAAKRSTSIRSSPSAFAASPARNPARSWTTSSITCGPRSSPAASIGNKTRWRSGTTAAPNTTPSPTTAARTG